MPVEAQQRLYAVSIRVLTGGRVDEPGYAMTVWRRYNSSSMVNDRVGMD